MNVVVKRKHGKDGKASDEIRVYKPKRIAQLQDVLRDLWEHEYNSSDPEPDREESWFEESQARIENELYVTDFLVIPLVEVEL